MNDSKPTITLEEMQKVQAKSTRRIRPLGGAKPSDPSSDRALESAVSVIPDVPKNAPSNATGKQRRWAKRLLIGIVIVVVLAIAIFALGVYWFKWSDPVTRAVTTTLPYPAAIVGAEWVMVKDYQDNLDAVRYVNNAKVEQGIDPSALLSDEENQVGVYDTLVRSAVIRELAKNNGVTVTNQEVDDEFNALAQEAGDEVDAIIKDFYGLSREQFKTNVIGMFLLADKLDSKLQADPQFQDPARAEAGQILEKIRAGEDFATLAQQFGDDNTRTLGGDLGYFGRGRMVKEFEDAVFALEVGQVSEPVLTKFGFHIIKLEERKAGEAEDGGDLLRARHILIKPVVFDDWVAEHESEVRTWKFLPMPPLPGATT